MPQINKKSFLDRIKQGVKGAGQTIKRTTSAVKSNEKAKTNITKLAGKYGIVGGTYGRKNYNTVIKKGKEFTKKGDMVGMRNYFKSQQEKAKKQ